MAYKPEANLSFGFHNRFVNTFLQVFNNVSLVVNVMPVVETSQVLTQQALYLSLCTFTNTTNMHETILEYAPQLWCLFEGGAY